MAKKSVKIAFLVLSALMAAQLIEGANPNDSKTAEVGKEQKGPGDLLLPELVSLNQAYTPITNLQDPVVVAAAQYSVREFNRHIGGVWHYRSVVSGEQQVIAAGRRYRLVIACSDGRIGRIYNFNCRVVRNSDATHRLEYFEMVRNRNRVDESW